MTTNYYLVKLQANISHKINICFVKRQKEDESLYDNAKGFTNFAAPGADRFKIELPLVKKLLDDTSDSNFVEAKEHKINYLKLQSRIVVGVTY